MSARTSLLVAIVLAAPAVAVAGDPKFEFVKPDAVKPEKLEEVVEWKATAEAGAVFTTGNAETTTITGGFKASRKDGRNRLSLEASLARARSGIRIIEDKNGNGTIDSTDEITTESTDTAETYMGKARYDRFLTDNNTLFAALLASRDVPAGKDLVLGGQLGYMRQLHKSKQTEVVGEFGYDFSREDLAVGDPLDIHSLRAFVGLKAAAAEGVDLDASLEALSNLNKLTLPTGRNGDAFMDTRVNGHLGISAKLSKSLAVQTAIDVKYDNRPGPLAIKNLAMGFVPEAANLDTIMKASLIYTLF